MKIIEIIGGIAGIVSASLAFQMIAPSIFEVPTIESGINWYRTLFAGLAGAIGAALGLYAGKVISKK